MRKVEKINVVCFGGGTGLPSLLSGLKDNPWLNLTAIVNMFDMGGSSGHMRDMFGLLPPGDILKCLLALAKHEQVAREILLQRITYLKDPGHTGGNALLLGLEKLFDSFPVAVSALTQILEAQGNVEPVTLEQASMCARYTDGSTCKTEIAVDIAIKEGKMVREIFLEPEVAATDRVIAAIESADVFVVGPGSLYTSVLPNFLPLGVVESLHKSKAPVVYVMNLVTEGRGMRGMGYAKYVEVVEYYLKRAVDAVVVNNKFPNAQVLSQYSQEGKYAISSEGAHGWERDRLVIKAPLWQGAMARHSSSHLGYLLTGVIHELLY